MGVRLWLGVASLAVMLACVPAASAQDASVCVGAQPCTHTDVGYEVTSTVSGAAYTVCDPIATHHDISNPPAEQPPVRACWEYGQPNPFLPQSSRNEVLVVEGVASVVITGTSGRTGSTSDLTVRLIP